MPYRKITLATDEIYHVFNRGVAKHPIFSEETDYTRLTDLINYYRFEKPCLRFSYFIRLAKTIKDNFWNNLKDKSQPLVEIISYCLMPNHFHLLLKQLKENGISIFMSNFQNSYVRFFNTKHKRPGPLFQSIFKAVRVETNDQLLYVNRYIHLNPSSSRLVEIDKLTGYVWSSFPHYLGSIQLPFIKPELVLDQFKNIESYRKFVFDQADYQRKLDDIKHLVLELI